MSASRPRSPARVPPARRPIRVGARDQAGWDDDPSVFDPYIPDVP
jgi:hypothetical protein